MHAINTLDHCINLNCTEGTKIYEHSNKAAINFCWLYDNLYGISLEHWEGKKVNSKIKSSKMYL